MSEIGPESTGSGEVRRIFETNRDNILKKSGSDAEGANFKDLLTGFIDEVNDLQLEAGDKIEKLASGEVKDLHEVMIASQEADTSFKMMMDIRNRLLTAYKEISKMGGG